MSVEIVLWSLVRIVHIATAIVMVGGVVFMRLLLVPAAEATLPGSDHDNLRQKILARWKMVVHGGIALFLVSGGLNYWRIISTGIHKGDGLYHALLGIKIILALVIFFIASLLVGKTGLAQKVRGNMKKWMAVNIVLAAIIVCLSGLLKVRTDFNPHGPVITPAVSETR